MSPRFRRSHCRLTSRYGSGCAVNVGVVGGGFVPNGPGIPYAFEYALKVLDIAAKYRKGEKWEYMPAPQFNHGVM